MFEDFGEADGVDVEWESAPDRAVLHGIWTRLQSGDLDAAHGWAALFERYPDDRRFLLFLSYWQRSTASAPIDVFFRQVERIAADAVLREPLTDLLSIAREQLRDELRGAVAAQFERMAAPFGGARRDERESKARLSRLERRVLEELHDRTLGNRPLAPKRKPAEMRVEDWPTMREKARNDPETPYSTTTRFKVGAKLRHPTLGIGFVTARREGKIDVLFESGRRTLIGK